MVTGSVTTGGEDEVVDGVVSLVPAQVVVSPAETKAPVLFAALLANSEVRPINCAATNVSGSVLVALQGPVSSGRMPTLTAALPSSGDIAICPDRKLSRT